MANARSGPPDGGNGEGGPIRSQLRPEGSVLLIVLLIVLLAWGFVVLADVVSNGATDALDARIVRSLRRESDLAATIGPEWLAVAARDVTSLGGAAVLSLAFLAVAGYLALLKKPRAIVFLAAASLGGLALDLTLKGIVSRPRPDVVPHLDRVATSSFPSGHSMLSAIVFLTLGTLVARVTPGRLAKLYVISVALAATFLVGSSRVFLGVHYPTDVLAGWSAGLVWALVLELLARFLQRRGAVEK